MKKIELLQSVALFWDLSEEELGYISEKMIARHYESGKFIFLEDSEGEQCFFVVQGSVKVTRLSKDGREVILAMLNEGEFFGEMALLDGESRSANVIALEETEVLTLNREDFLVVLHDYPQIAIQLLKEMADRLRKSDRQIASLSLSDAEKRIALCIIRFADEQGIIKRGQVSIPKMPIQQDIANMAGTSRETVSRAINLLEKEHFIKRQGRELLILDYKQFIKEFDY
ncbi:MAG: Crp/Fnr family transcriptional regulator [Candidatus Neomarinimicrobiota bacterium]|jgi:CRP-like cAMP-binding protein|nr:Crp/Fnr family transcriptional regulator [Candidatus Neomarinimicrobiota bacterium]|tara:strand:+ start:3368 stop:4051 length:684 start_codon:yes stop_codon:yes gene_type:complete